MFVFGMYRIFFCPIDLHSVCIEFFFSRPFTSSSSVSTEETGAVYMYRACRASFFFSFLYLTPMMHALNQPLI
uniref:Uncharacterized protein n=1 Tax=Zea mays TaxID=4577 RepID=B7ZXV3_MAIZE|nr:unknown [Zea mays]